MSKKLKMVTLVFFLLVTVVVGLFIKNSTNSKLYNISQIVDWERSNTGLTDTEVKNIIRVALPTTLFLQTKYSLFKSIDEGTTWVEITSLPVDKEERQSMIITSHCDSGSMFCSEGLLLGTSPRYKQVKDNFLGIDMTFDEGITRFKNLNMRGVNSIYLSPLYYSSDGGRTWNNIRLSCFDNKSHNDYLSIEGISFDNLGNMYIQTQGINNTNRFMTQLLRSSDYRNDYSCKDIGDGVFDQISDSMRSLNEEIIRPGFYGFFGDPGKTYAISEKNIYEATSSGNWRKTDKPKVNFEFTAVAETMGRLLVGGFAYKDKPEFSIEDLKIYIKEENAWIDITGNLPDVYIHSLKSYAIAVDKKNYIRIFAIGISAGQRIDDNKYNNKRGAGDTYVLYADIDPDSIPKNIKWVDITGELNEKLRIKNITDVEIKGDNILLGTKDQGILRGRIKLRNSN